MTRATSSIVGSLFEDYGHYEELLLGTLGRRRTSLNKRTSSTKAYWLDLSTESCDRFSTGIQWTGNGGLSLVICF